MVGCSERGIWEEFWLQRLKNITIKLCKDIWCPGRASKQAPSCSVTRTVPLFRPLATHFVWGRNLVVSWRAISLQPDSCQHPKEDLLYSALDLMMQGSCYRFYRVSECNSFFGDVFIGLVYFNSLFGVRDKKIACSKLQGGGVNYWKVFILRSSSFSGRVALSADTCVV
jgi:hypothetical protein